MVIQTVDFRVVAGTGAFAPVNFNQWVHASVLIRIVEVYSDIKIRKSLVQSSKLKKMMPITHTL